MLSAEHDTGLRVTYTRFENPSGEPWRIAAPHLVNAAEVEAALSAKHGHNAAAMIRRLTQEARALHDFASERQARRGAARNRAWLDAATKKDPRTPL